jgi:monothiol glutaredoxin
MATIHDTIHQQIKKNDVVLYMKGTSLFPQCGFSSQVVNILNELGVDFTSYNVLDSQELREGIKNFSNWPTIPQLYIHGEFIGGCDIVTDMYESGELVKLLKA